MLRRSPVNCLEEITKRERVAWGAGRVVFRANLADIQVQLNEGWPMSTVYHRLRNSLGGLSYRAFTKLVNQHFRQAPKQVIRDYETISQGSESDGLARIGESATRRAQANDKKTNTSGRSAKFRPGPRIPDPRDLY